MDLFFCELKIALIYTILVTSYEINGFLSFSLRQVMKYNLYKYLLNLNKIDISRGYIGPNFLLTTEYDS